MLASTLTNIKIAVSRCKSFSYFFCLTLQKVNIYFLVSYPAIKSIYFIFICYMALLSIFQVDIHLIYFRLQRLNEMLGILVLLFHLSESPFVFFNKILKFNELSRWHVWFLLFLCLLGGSSQLLFGPTMFGPPLSDFFTYLFKLLRELLLHVSLLLLDLLPLEPH